MDTADKKLPIPPYVAYKTLKNFLERFTGGVPGRIDRGLMGSMSGAAQSQVSTALKYLGFASETGIPTETLKSYVLGDDAKRKEVLRQVLGSAYPFVFSKDANFDFGSATSSQLREEFEAKTSATGETVGRCIAFLKDAASDAEIVISPYILQKKSRSSATRRRSSAPRHESKPARKQAAETPSLKLPPKPLEGIAAPIAAQESMLLWGLFKRLPKPGTAWVAEDREHWLQTLKNVLLLEYGD